MKKILLSLMLVSLGTLPLIAQTPPPSQPSPPRAAEAGTKIRAVLFTLAPRIFEAYAFDPADTTGAPGVKIEIKTYLNDEGAMLPLKGNGLILASAPSRDSLSKPDSIIANVKLPPHGRSAILMLLPGTGKEGDPKCRALAYDASPMAFPVATYQVTNLSPNPVRYIIGAKTYEFKPGEVQLIKDAPIPPGDSVPMQALSFKNNQWVQINSSVWCNLGSSRELQVLFENPKSGRVEMNSMQDTSF